MSNTDDFPAQFGRTRRFALGVPGRFAVSPDGRRVLFLRTRSGADPVTCLWSLCDGREHLLADPRRDPGGVASTGPHSLPGPDSLPSPDSLPNPDSVPEAEAVQRARDRQMATGISSYTADHSLETVVFALRGELWSVPADGSDAPRLLPTAEAATAPRLDPLGRRVAYLAGNTLRVVDLREGDRREGDLREEGPREEGPRDRAVAVPEGPEISYGSAEHVAAESMFRSRGFWWSPDGTRLLVARVDHTAVSRWWVADAEHPEREPRALRYPAAGTANARVTLAVHSPLPGGRPPVDVVWDRSGFEYLASAGWDGHGLLLSVQSRDQRTVRVLTGDPDTGETRCVAEEHDPHWVSLFPGAPLRTGRGVVFSVAGRDDTYRLLADGRTVTPAGLNVREVLGAVGESVYFMASDDPQEVHVWRYRPDAAGAGLVRISEGPGVHRATVPAVEAPDDPDATTGQPRGHALVMDARTEGGRGTTVVRSVEETATGDAPSAVASAAAATAAPAADARNAPATDARNAVAPTAVQPAPVRTLHRLPHRAERPLLTPRVTWLSAGPHRVRTALLLPSWYQRGDADDQPLPVLLSPYAGPAMQLAVRAWHWPFAEAQWFAEQGFAVVIADGRGTPGRGPAWERSVYGDKFGPVLEDQVCALAAAAEYEGAALDLAKVAIRGWSFAGTLAMMAVLRRPETFHAAVSGAGPCDQSLYDTHWSERFLGHPAERPESYRRASPVHEAASLRRPLLLIHGTADDNVVFSHLLRMSAALLAAGRPHEVLPLAGSGHAPAGEATIARLLGTQLRFLRTSLGVAANAGRSSATSPPAG